MLLFGGIQTLAHLHDPPYSFVHCSDLIFMFLGLKHTLFELRKYIKEGLCFYCFSYYFQYVPKFQAISQ